MTDEKKCETCGGDRWIELQGGGPHSGLAPCFACNANGEIPYQEIEALGTAKKPDAPILDMRSPTGPKGTLKRSDAPPDPGLVALAVEAAKARQTQIVLNAFRKDGTMIGDSVTYSSSDAASLIAECGESSDQGHTIAGAWIRRAIRLTPENVEEAVELISELEFIGIGSNVADAFPPRIVHYTDTDRFAMTRDLVNQFGAPVDEPTVRIVDEIGAERARQVTAEHHPLEKDDEFNRNGELARAAAAYCLAVVDYKFHNVAQAPICWPWHPNTFKPKDARRNLIRAGALIVAELERLERLAAVAAAPKQGGYPTRAEADEFNKLTETFSTFRDSELGSKPDQVLKVDEPVVPQTFEEFEAQKQKAVEAAKARHVERVKVDGDVVGTIAPVIDQLDVARVYRKCVDRESLDSAELDFILSALNQARWRYRLANYAGEIKNHPITGHPIPAFPSIELAKEYRAELEAEYKKTAVAPDRISIVDTFDK